MALKKDKDRYEMLFIFLLLISLLMHFMCMYLCIILRIRKDSSRGILLQFFCILADEATLVRSWWTETK